MARRFAEPGTIAAVSSSFKTLVVIAGTAATRPKIFHFALSTLGAAADGVLEWILQRFTAAGTTTAVTPRNLDATDPSAAVGVAGAYSMEMWTQQPPPINPFGFVFGFGGASQP